MGTTSEKLTYLNGTKQLLKDKINNLGGSIDDNTTFRNYANQLQNVYDNLPKTEYQEGTEINLGKTIKGKLDYDNGVVGIGQTEQDSTQGYNLFVDIATQTLNGMTITKTDNGYILNGTTTDNTTFRGTITNVANTNKSICAKCDTAITNANIQVKTRNSAYTQLRSISLGNANTWVVDSGTYEDYYCDIFVRAGVTLNNALLQPMLLNGTYTTSNVPNYEQYTGGQVSPNPSYPQQIKSVTGNQDVVVSGKNLINLNNSENGGIDASGSLVDNTQNWRGTEYIPVKPNTQYTFSTIGYNGIVYLLRLYEFDENKNFISPRSQGDNSSTLTMTTTSNTKYLKWTIFLTNTDITTEIVNSMDLMLTKGTDTTYEPYITPTSYQLSLGEYEFAKIGNYVDTIEYDVDEDKVYKNKAINKVLLKTLTWGTSVVGTNSYGTASLLSYIGKVATDINIICSHATGIIFNDRNLLTNTTIYDETNGYVVFRNTSFTSLEDFTTFLNNNNVYAYYVLATETREEITGTLKDQIKALYNAHSLNGTTIIEGNGDLPMIIKCRGLKGE